jgi:uncharacterized membrane protein
MGLEIFLFSCNLLVPIIMLLFGIKLRKHEPKNINGIYGYRTTMSMKNKETWKFANQYCGLVWEKIGAIMLILSIIISVIALTRNYNVQGNICGILVTIQSLVLVASIFPVEKELKKNFDENGNRKD